MKEISIVDVLVNSDLCSSRGEAKRLIRGNGIYINDISIDENYKFDSNLKAGDILKLSCGKKRNLLIKISD